MKYLRPLALTLLSVVVLAFSGLGAAQAATTAASTQGSGQALEIAPPLLYLNANPGQSIKAQIDIRDISKVPQLVTSQVNDFVANGTTGIPKILLNNDTNDPYSIKSFVPPIQSLLLQPQQIKTLTVPIDVPASASPGGHYGVIRFTAIPQAINGTNGVALSASLGTLVLLTVSGHIVNNLSVASFTTAQSGHKSSFFQNLPVTFNELIKNSGNVHEEPSGLLTVKDMFGHKLVNLQVNANKGNVLPSSSRLFSENLISANVGNRFMFGHYSATINLTYGSPAKTLTASVGFWIIPLTDIIILIVVLIGGFFLLRWLIKRYNQHILDRAQKPRSK